MGEESGEDMAGDAVADDETGRDDIEASRDGIEANLSLSCVEERSPVQNTVNLFLQFKGALVMNGTLQWRIHTETKDSFIMSNMNCKTGKIMVCTCVVNGLPY